MSDQSPSKLKHALNFGALLGLILMIFSLVTYVFELYEMQLLSYLGGLVLIAGIVMGIKKYRDDACGGFISYGSALGYGVMLALFASIIVNIISYVYLGYIDDGFLQYTIEKAEMDMYEQGQPDEQIEMAMGYTRKFTTAGFVSVMGVIMTTILGFIVSLIAAAFLKKESDSFEDA